MLESLLPVPLLAIPAPGPTTTRSHNGAIISFYMDHTIKAGQIRALPVAATVLQPVSNAL